jgi:hypothetical protein
MAHRASFTVALGDARVRIIVLSEGRRLHVTAVCSRRHVEIVRRAIGHASAGLRLHGALVEETIRCEEASA